VSDFSYPLSFQTMLPDSYQSDVAFSALCRTMRELGFHGIELNMKRFGSIDLADLTAFLSQYGLALPAFASGLTAKEQGLSLSAEDEPIRNRSVDIGLKMIDHWADRSASIIFGIMKGASVQNIANARSQCRRSLDALVPHAQKRGVTLVLEATNRYEASVANSLEDSVSLIEAYGVDSVEILPDTFHMNIEEADMFESIEKFLPHFSSLHISDNNRYFPGFGAISFERIISHLRSLNYSGRIAIEGNIKDNLLDDLKSSLRYLRPFLTSA
jgi:D-psicose/D-tagatose/L-ribulose 3-epimerase